MGVAPFLFAREVDMAPEIAATINEMKYWDYLHSAKNHIAYLKTVEDFDRIEIVESIISEAATFFERGDYERAAEIMAGAENV